MAKLNMTEEQRSFFSEKGRRSARSLLDRMYADVDSRFTGLDQKTRDQFARELYRRHFADLGRRNRGKTRKNA
jgi:hypothetical protein